MVLNYIWIAFFLIALVVAIIKTIGGDMDVFSAIVNSTFDMASTSFEIAIGLTGVLCLWLGIMKIGEDGGAIKILSKLVGPFFNKLFPDLPIDHPARGSMLMNFSANMLGLDNAATPMGLKAMNEMQEVNPTKDTASNAQIMFLVLNTSGLTLIPVVVMNYRNLYGAENPADIFLPILIATFFASLVGLITVAIYQKINLFNKVILAYLGTLTLLIVGMIWYFTSLAPEALAAQSKLFSSIVLYGLICAFII
ncbi:MAG: nucleoside recognition domain-containing protein, partial [Putridiphycobacter sp.]|nr:nucleoside recognition domain-containing protein [Putridiphycobacter sp.]